MIRVVLVELRRFSWRRSFRLFGFLALAGIALAAVIAFFSSDPAEPALIREYEDQVSQCLSNFEQSPEQIPAGYPDAEAFCSDIVPIQSIDSRFRITELTEIYEGTSIPLIILGLAFGASFIGAEWHSGTITTLLTWEPRRTRVMIGKILAIAIAVFCSAIVLQAILGAALWPVAALRGTTEGANAAWLGDTIAVAARGSLIAALASALGFGIASLARNTAVTLIIGFVYFAVAEGIMRGLRPRWQPWLIGDNAAAFVTAEPENIFSAGLSHGVLTSLLIVVAYAAGLSAIAIAWFKARDVT